MIRILSATLLSFGLAVVLTQTGRAQAPAPAPATGGQQPVRVGGDIKPPTRTKSAQPVYPADARAARLGGTVMIEATIDEAGKVTRTLVMRSAGAMLDEAAVAAVQQWEYTPTVVNGKPVPVIMIVTVNFAVENAPPQGARGGMAPTPAAPGAARGVPVPAPAPYDLTGVWRGDDGGTYQIRTIGVEIFWTGKSDSGAWANVFHGGWSPQGQYNGRFVDVPPGSIANDGTIAVRPVNQNLLEMVGDPTNFTGRKWERVGPPVSSGPPPPGPTRGIGVPGAGRAGAAPAALQSPIPAGQFGAGAYRMGAQITGPWISKQANPKYTQDAMRAKIEGNVQMEAVVKEDGTIGDVRVTRSLDAGLDKEAMATLKDWRFTPAQDSTGRRVPVLVTIDMSFRLH